MRHPFPSLLVCGLSLITLTACTTIQNRRDLYFPGTVQGPYTRMLEHRLKAPSPTLLRFPRRREEERTWSGPRGRGSLLRPLSPTPLGVADPGATRLKASSCLEARPPEPNMARTLQEEDLPDGVFGGSDQGRDRS